MSESRFTKKAGGGSSEGRLVFIRPADLARANFSGIVAEGELLGTSPNKYDEDKVDFKIKSDVSVKAKGANDKEGEYSIEINPGDTIIVNAAGNLGFLMKNVGPGELCQISYLGKNEIQKGKRAGTMAHNFQVAYGQD